MQCPKIKPSSVSEQICLLKYTPLLNVTGSYEGILLYFILKTFCRRRKQRREALSLFEYQIYYSLLPAPQKQKASPRCTGRGKLFVDQGPF